MANFPVTPADVSLFIEGDEFVFRNDASFALYWYELDSPNKSNCNDACALLWPPVVPPTNATPVGDWTIIERADSSRQWAYRGKPVYTYSKDQPGAFAGDGLDGVWHMLRG